MKFKGSVIINKPLLEVVRLFEDPNNLKEWQEGFIKKELLEGTLGTNGAISKIYLKQGKSTIMELTETVISNNLPATFEAFYHHKHMDNTLQSSFSEISETQTLFQNDGEYLAFRGIIPKAMAFLFPKLFEKQAQKWMDNFKRFAEKQ